MPAGRYDLTIEQGATWAEDFFWLVDDAPVDLTGATARLHARDGIASGGTLLFELTDANGGILLGGDAGSIGLRMSAEATAALSASEGLYDLEIVFGVTVVRLLQGRVTLRPNLTQ